MSPLWLKRSRKSGDLARRGYWRSPRRYLNPTILVKPRQIPGRSGIPYLHVRALWLFASLYYHLHIQPNEMPTSAQPAACGSSFPMFLARQKGLDRAEGVSTHHGYQ